MGTFTVPIAVGDPAGERWETLDALVDTGSTYTWVPESILRALAVRPIARWDFEFANGEVGERDVAETWVRYDGQVSHTWVVFVDDTSPTLLGAYTLEGFRLGVDPVRRRLVPVRGLAMMTRKGAVHSRARYG